MPPSPDAPANRTCALAGCDTAVVSPGRGGRPRMYCSDAHRAQARRRRLQAGTAGEQGPVPAALGKLHQAVALLEGAVAASADRAAEDAAARARATAQVLDAQRAAADSAVQLAETRHELGRTRQALEDVWRQRAELEAALEGARAELEDELLRHHRDVAQLEAVLGRRPGG